MLAGSKADLLAFETIPSLAEGEAIVRLLEEFPELRAWLSFSCRDAKQVCHGEDLARCAALANELPGVIATGINCTAPQYVEDLLSCAKAVTEKPLLAYPNSGEHWQSSDNCWIGDSADLDLPGSVASWREAGASLIGGCCRTTPEDIRQIADELKSNRV